MNPLVLAYLSGGTATAFLFVLSVIPNFCHASEQPSFQGGLFCYLMPIQDQRHSEPSHWEGV